MPRLRRSLLWLALIILSVPASLWYQTPARADGLDSRFMFIGDSIPGATTTYDFGFNITVAGLLGSIQFEFCENTPIVGDPCTAPPGFDISAAVLDLQSGETGFTIAPGATANNIVLTRVPALAVPQASTYDFSNVINPSTPGLTNYVRITTYPTDDATGPYIEDGGIAFAITYDFSVSAFVPPYLEFCVGVTITANDCSTASGNLVDFGILDETTISSTTSQFNGGTNGVGGYGVSVIGNTMTSGTNTIPALNSPTGASPGFSRFGLNLRDNSNPNVGANPTGPGTIVPLGDYNLPNQYTYREGDQIAASPISTNYSTVTVSYVVTISEDQAPGIYTTTLTYVATATF